MNDEPLDERTAAFFAEVRATFQVAEAPAPSDALSTLFVEGLANDKGDRLVTVASNANGSADMQTAGLPNWTRRTTNMIRELLKQVSGKIGAGAFGAILALASVAAAGAVGVVAQTGDTRMASDTTDIEDPADDPSEGAVTDEEGGADWTGVTSPEDCVGNGHDCWVALAEQNEDGHTCADHDLYVSQVADNEGDEARYYFDTDCDGELNADEQAAYDAFVAAAEENTDPAEDDVEETDEEEGDDSEIATPADCTDANHGCWVSLAAHNKDGHTCANHGRYVSQVAKNKGDEAQYYFDTDCDGELSEEEQAAHDEAMGTSTSTEDDGSADAEGEVEATVAESPDAGAEQHPGKGHGNAGKDKDTKSNGANHAKGADKGKGPDSGKGPDNGKGKGKGGGRP